MRINGWQRLWLLASVLWALVVLSLAGQFDSDHTISSANEALIVARLWLVPVTVAYGLGLGLAWVRRGFQLSSR